MIEGRRQALAIPGVALRPLAANRDARGHLTEVFRASWPEALAVRRWSLLRGEAGSLRGMRLRLREETWIAPLAGRLLLGLRDCRARSGGAALLELSPAEPAGLRIPPGVALGCLHLEPCLLLLGRAGEDPADELGCRHDDPALGIAWPDGKPRLAARDRDAGGFAALLGAVAERLDEVRGAAGLSRA